MPSTERILVENIVEGAGRRALNDDAVDSLVGSIEALGLRTPITVRVVDDMEVDGEPCDGVPVLVAGAHRLAAVRRLGWQYVDCFVAEDGDPIKAELWELAENLHRCGLSKVERTACIKRYAELLETQQAGVSRQSVAKSNPVGRPAGVAKQIADETGLSQRTVQRALAPPKPKPVSPPSAPLNDYDAANKLKARLIGAWNAAPPEIREWFRDWIDTPVMDNTRTGS